MKNSFNTGKTFKANVFPLILLTFFCLFAQFIYGVNIEVRPISIQFNYEPGNANDAVDISDVNGNTISGAEWTSSTSKDFAYIIGERSRKIKVKFSSNYSGNMNVIINLTSDSNNKIGTICNMFIPNFNPAEMDLLLPAYELPCIGKFTFTWKWEIYAMPTGSTSYCPYSTPTNTTHTYYTLFATPKTPMTTPPIDILDYACDWASGKSDQNSICNDILNRGFNNCYTYESNCHELSSDFVRLISSLGISASMHKWLAIGGIDDPNNMLYMKTRIIDPVGSVCGSGNYIWAWHQWAEAASYQRDPSSNFSLYGTWGNYEDYLFTEYLMVTSPYVSEWVSNQGGQDKGCETADNRYYTNYPTSYTFILEEWKGPDR